MISTALPALGALAWVVAALKVMTDDDNGSVTGGLLMLLVTPLVFLICLAMVRMSMEMYVAVTRMADELGRIRDDLDRRA